MSENTQEKMDRLKSDPKKMIKDCREGSISALLDFMPLWSSVPWIFEDSLSPLSAFLPHLDTRLIRGGGSRDRQAFTDAEHRAVLSLAGISYGRGHLQSHDHIVRQLQKAWPGIFKWMVHLFSKWLGVAVSEIPWPGGMTADAVVSGTLRAFSEVPSLNQLLTSTPGCIELATQIFINTPSNGSLFSVSMTGFKGLLSKTTLSSQTFFQRMISVDGCNTSTITNLVMSRIHIATQEDGLNDRHQVVALLDMLHDLSSIPAMSAAFLEANAVSQVTLVAYSLSCLVQHDRNYVRPTLLCLSYLAKNLESGDGVTPIRQSIKHGLLAAWAICSDYLDGPLPDNVRGGSIVKIINDIIPRYLTYRSIIQQTYNFFEKCPVHMEEGYLKAPWDRFMELFEERYTLMLQAPLRKIGCDNALCAEVLTLKTKFMKCTGCRQLEYCSKKCQKVDWKSGHREMCKIVQEDYDKVEEIGEMTGYHLRKRDRAFHYALSQTDAFWHKDILLCLAEEKHPSVPLAKLIIFINYITVPPTYSLQHIDEYKEYLSAAIKVREHQDLENLQNDPRCLRIENKVSRGTSSETFTTKIPREFWDQDYIINYAR